MSSLASLLSQVRAQIEKSGASAKLIAVSKTVPVERVFEAYEAGQRDFGENKVQELSEKAPKLPDDINWHFIGRLQTNKVKYLFPKSGSGQASIPLIHSLDRVSLAEALQEMAQKRGVRTVPCLLQVNSSGEESKAGFSEEELLTFLKQWPKDSCLEFRGLMTMAPLTKDAALIRETFSLTRKLLERLREEFSEYPWKELSMGMSGDFEIALKEGATMVRVGSAIFGERNK